MPTERYKQAWTIDQNIADPMRVFQAFPAVFPGQAPIWRMVCSTVLDCLPSPVCQSDIDQDTAGKMHHTHSCTTLHVATFKADLISLSTSSRDVSLLIHFYGINHCAGLQANRAAGRWCRDISTPISLITESVNALGSSMGGLNGGYCSVLLSMVG